MLVSLISYRYPVIGGFNLPLHCNTRSTFEEHYVVRRRGAGGARPTRPPMKGDLFTAAAGATAGSLPITGARYRRARRLRPLPQAVQAKASLANNEENDPAKAAGIINERAGLGKAVQVGTSLTPC